MQANGDDDGARIAFLEPEKVELNGNAITKVPDEVDQNGHTGNNNVSEL